MVIKIWRTGDGPTFDTETPKMKGEALSVLNLEVKWTEDDFKLLLKGLYKLMGRKAFH